MGDGNIMKVLHVITSLDSGGAENLVKESLPIMKQKGLEPEVLLLSSKNNVFEDELRNEGIKIQKTGLNNVYSPRQIFKIKKFINGYDIVHTHLFQPQYWTTIAKILYRSNTPIITTEHSTNNRRREHKIFKNIDRFIYKKYDKIICISKETEKNLIKWIPRISSKTIVVYNGTDLNKFRNSKPYKKEELIKNVGENSNSKLILMVSRFSVQKDHETLIRAAKLLSDDYHVILVGEGSLKEDIILLVEKLNISHRVHFLNYREDVERIMKSVDIYVQSSNWEGFGIAALEAMATGIPVIASNTPGLSEVVEGGGVLFPKGDHISLANAIKDISTSKKRYKEISNNCMEKCKQFSIEKMVDEYIKIYSGLLK